MKGTYTEDLGGGVYAVFFYDYEADTSGDYHTPNGGATIDIHKVTLEDGKSSVDITHCVDELCSMSITDIEDKIQIDIQ